MSAATEPVLQRREGPVLHLTLNRPEARNAMSLALVQALIDGLKAAEVDGQTRVLVLRGTGGHFCAGADLKDMARSQQLSVDPALQGSLQDPIAQTNAAFGHLCAAYARSPLVTVAVLEGTVMGGGFGLACAVDVTLASETVQFRLPETSLGLLPAQIAPFLMERLGYAQAKRLSVTGGRLGWQKALAIGLVHEAVPSEQIDACLAQQLHEILQCAPAAIAATKRLLAEGRFAEPASMINRAAEAFAQAARGLEAAEGTQAFVGKRKPSWAPGAAG
jgi:isohexenylglutaconyl-CoA hydratase